MNAPSKWSFETSVAFFEMAVGSIWHLPALSAALQSHAMELFRALFDLGGVPPNFALSLNLFGFVCFGSSLLHADAGSGGA